MHHSMEQPTCVGIAKSPDSCQAVIQKPVVYEKNTVFQCSQYFCVLTDRINRFHLFSWVQTIILPLSVQKFLVQNNILNLGFVKPHLVCILHITHACRTQSRCGAPEQAWSLWMLSPRSLLPSAVKGWDSDVAP